MRIFRMFSGSPKAMLVAGALLLGPQIGWAAPTDSAFGKFSGEWRGSGQVTGTDGKSESITCRARYDISASGESLTQALVCASDSYRFDIRSNVVADGENASGGWQETTRNITGNLIGHIRNGDFEGNVSGADFTAEVSLRLSGRKQDVVLTPHGGDVAKVQIALSRAS
jgi:hypothetical protein